MTFWCESFDIALASWKSVFKKSEGIGMIRLLTAFLILFVAATTGAKAAECDVFSQQVVMTPAPFQKVLSVKKMNKVIEEPAANPDVVFFGDSILDNWSDSIIEKQFPSEVVWNTAIGGARIQGLLWQLEAIKNSGITKKMQPKSVLVMIGTNNLGDTSTASCAIAQGIEKSVLMIKSFWPETNVYVAPILPRGPSFAFADEARLEINQAVEDWAMRERHVKALKIDDHEITCGEYDPSGENDDDVDVCGKPANSCSNYRADGLHLEAGGYDVLYEAFEAARG